jgi:DNA repair protein RecO (recombination protein O)
VSPTDSNNIESQALLLGRVQFGEADLILHLFTDVSGRISALARGARKSKRRFSGTLEPMHTLRIEFSKTGRSDLHTLKGAQLLRPRTGLTSRLATLEAAGKALNWLRHAAPHETPEPHLWRATNGLLDELAEPDGEEHATGLLTAFGLRLLEVLGWGLNLQSCVSCAKPCPPGRSAWINPERGGLVCRECGGGPIRLSSKAREQMFVATQDDQMRIGDEWTSDFLRVVDRALSAHMGAESRASTDLGSRLK